jgi:membrane protein YqaA with SNARE-associated domain
LNVSYERFYAHANSKWSLIIGFLWGFAEATVFFIVPDVYLGFVALFHWRRGFSVAIAALLGAMLGGSVLYFLAMNNPSSIHRLLIRVPLIDTALVNEVAETMRADGLVTILTGPLKGTPYKIYAAQAGEQAVSFLSFLLMTIPARLERFFPVVLVFRGIGRWFQTFSRKHTTLVVLSYTLLWCMIYFVFITYFGFH